MGTTPLRVEKRRDRQVLRSVNVDLMTNSWANGVELVNECHCTLNLMRIVSTFHPPSSVTDAIKCRLTSDHSLIHLVVAKSNRLDIYSVQPSGLSHECGADIWGRIVVVKAIPTTVTASTSLMPYVTDLAIVGWQEQPTFTHRSP